MSNDGEFPDLDGPPAGVQAQQPTVRAGDALDRTDEPVPAPNIEGLTLACAPCGPYDLPDAVLWHVFMSCPSKESLRSVCRHWRAVVDERRTRLVLHSFDDASEADVAIVCRWLRRCHSLASLEVQACLPPALAARIVAALSSSGTVRELRLRPTEEAALAAYDAGTPRLYFGNEDQQPTPPPPPAPPASPAGPAALHVLRSALPTLRALSCLEIDLGTGYGVSAHAAALELLEAAPRLEALAVLGGPNGTGAEVAACAARVPPLRSLRVSPGLGYSAESTLWVRPPHVAYCPAMAGRQYPPPPPPAPRVRPVPVTSFFHFRAPPAAPPPALHRLDLSGTDLGDDRTLEPILIAALRQCPQLAALSLADCRLEGLGCLSSVGRFLADAASLLYLSIADNPLGPVGFDAMWRAATGTPGGSPLRELDASNCEIDEKLSGSSGVGLSLYPNLSVIRLAGNRKMGFATARFLVGLRSTPRRCELIDLRACGIGSTQSMQKIGEIFHGRAAGPSVERLIVSHNDIVDDDIAMLEFIPGPYHITRMDFSHNGLSAAGVDRLSRALEPGRNPELVAIDLSHNPAVDERNTARFAAAAARNGNLREIGIGGHRIGMVFVFTLPRVLESNPSLEGLDLTGAAHEGATAIREALALAECGVSGLRRLCAARCGIDAGALAGALECGTRGPLRHLDLSGVPGCSLPAVLDAVREAGAAAGPEVRHIVVGEPPRKFVVAFSAAGCRVHAHTA